MISDVVCNQRFCSKRCCAKAIGLNNLKLCQSLSCCALAAAYRKRQVCLRTCDVVYNAPVAGDCTFHSLTTEARLSCLPAKRRCSTPALAPPTFHWVNDALLCGRDEKKENQCHPMLNYLSLERYRCGAFVRNWAMATAVMALVCRENRFLPKMTVDSSLTPTLLGIKM